MRITGLRNLNGRSHLRLSLSRASTRAWETVTVAADLPVYTTFAEAADPSISRVLSDDRLECYEQLQEKARALAASHGIGIRSHLVSGKQVEAIVDFLRRQKADLLVIGLHQRDLYVARLWSTVYELAQDAPCSVLGVH